MSPTNETAERSYTTVDKSGWGSGPWQHEPDKMQWRDTVTGLPCLIVRGPSGALCGYVGVAEGHPFFGKAASHCMLPEGSPDRGERCEDNWCRHQPSDKLEAHGGITFSDFCNPEGEKDPSRHICHIPEPGEPDRVYWFGFDCAHSGDHSPKYERDYEAQWSVYRTVDYVRAQVAQLAAQLVAHALPSGAQP